MINNTNIQTVLADNPFLAPYDTPFEAIPFDRIEISHILPAIKAGIQIEEREIADIADNATLATFENTIEPFEKSGEIIMKVSAVLNTYMNVRNDDELQALSEEAYSLLTEHRNNIYLNEKLFARIKAVYDNTDRTMLTCEQQRLLEIIYKAFVRAGANLSSEGKEKYRELTQQLNKLELKFQENTLKETDAYQLHITDASQLDGLPERLVESAAIAAQEAGKEGWVFTLHRPSYVPFLCFSTRRELRQELYMAYSSLGAKGDEYDNRALVVQIVNARLELARLLGYNTYSEYITSERMAQNVDAVFSLLGRLSWSYLPTARREVDEIKELAREIEGKDFEMMPWDFLYYSEKLKQKKYSINDEMLRPYFSLEQVLHGVTNLATRLYGITFRRNENIPVYHPDVQVFEVYDYDERFLALLYCDFFPRKGKRSGAWMDSIKGQYKDKTGVDHRPHVTLTTNATKPTAEKPAMLTIDEVNTLLHEFGHCLHGIFSDVTYQSMCSPDVLWDFVELPSQIMENFTTEKEFLNTFAFHYETGETIPDELLQKVNDARNFKVGYNCIRQVGLGLIDQAWHNISKPFDGEVLAYEHNVTEALALLPNVDATGITPQFSHIMTGGYSAGYYSYKWAEMLDADAFSLFKENGVFSTRVAQSFRDNILARGNSEHPKILYRRFRGCDPQLDALLARDGIETICPHL
jgi:peptidyl-dipeptidase Dcp